MTKHTFIATTAFGIEKVTKIELEKLGFDNLKTTDGKIEFEGDFSDMIRANLWLRSSERVLWKIKEFPAITFEDLFQGMKSIEWENIIPEKAQFIVNAKSVKSQLFSLRSCQSIGKKAIAERLMNKYEKEWLEESQEIYKIIISILKDTVTVSLDTSGVGLHKRGYRTESAEAPLRETLAASIILLSFWSEKRLLLDPMCGSGTIPIEAALIGRNIAPGLKREFLSESWKIIPEDLWRKERLKAYDLANKAELNILGSDYDKRSIDIAQNNARRAGVEDCIKFEHKKVDDLWIDQQYGIVITNPPYGLRLGNFEEINLTYISFNKIFKKKTGWSIYVLSADKKFPDYFKRSKPDRIRKLYNGKIETNLYQYYGDKPSN
ncbi:MAG: class I SAM-dependent RNA methyltransferase [Candidatus Muirbacterium halophilum]|nr:class I SAM-dependent RNA methyltransferase [Candidatus Muirbacterium halophilum]MCK9474892.1 class I SAM-dependent RNA methyltransferase [Candidatus Muirbacterium halophilum]